MDEMMMFRKTALLDGLCAEWDGMWASCKKDKEKLMKLVLMQRSAPYFATYCYQGKGLTKEYCKEEFADYINGHIFFDCDLVEGYSYGMYIDSPDVQDMTIDVAQFLWCDGTNVEIAETKCPRLYISNSSSVNITLNGCNSILVYLFDDSRVVVEGADENSNVVVYRYSANAEVEVGKFCFADVKVFDKPLKI